MLSKQELEKSNYEPTLFINEMYFEFFIAHPFKIYTITPHSTYIWIERENPTFINKCPLQDAYTL